MKYLENQANVCRDQQIVLAGFSQGAMVMHRVLHQLDTNQDRPILDRVADAVLIADGDQVPNDNQIRYGSAPHNARGIGQALRTVSHSSAAKFGTSVGSRVLSVCNRHDIVCGWTDTNILDCLISGLYCPIPVAEMVLIHLSYPNSKPLLAAADRAAADVLIGLQRLWVAVKAPVPPDAGSNTRDAFSSVACQSATACTAIGYYVDAAGNDQGLLVTGSGTMWTAIKPPLPPNADASAPETTFSSMACQAATACVITGSYQDSSGNTHGLLLNGSGSTWTATQATGPAGEPASVGSVTCPSATGCVVTGSYQDSSGNDQPMLLTGSGTTWTATRLSLPHNAWPTGSDPLACRSDNSCVAIASYGDSAGVTQGLLATGSGTTWTGTTVPAPAGAAYPGVTLDSVACPSTGACVVVGSYEDHSGIRQPLVLTASGTTWTEAEPVLPADASTYGVAFKAGYAACPPTPACIGAGSYETSTGTDEGVLLTGSGTTWTATEAPLPEANDIGPHVAFEDGSAACPSAAHCIAAASYIDSSGGAGMLVTGSGTNWTATKAPLPTGVSEEDLGPMACGSVTECVATGFYFDSSFVPHALLMTGPAG
jgi:hypothetical protein